MGEGQEDCTELATSSSVQDKALQLWEPESWQTEARPPWIAGSPPRSSRKQGRVRGSSHTRDGVLRVELKRVVHKSSHDGGGSLAVGVGRQEGVVPVVDMRGLVEAQAAVPHGLISQRRLQELSEDEAGLVEHRAVEQPAQRWCWLPIHGEGNTPVMLFHR